MITEDDKVKALRTMTLVPLAELNDLSRNNAHDACTKAVAMLAKARLLTKRLKLFCEVYNPNGAPVEEAL